MGARFGIDNTVDGDPVLLARQDNDDRRSEEPDEYNPFDAQTNSAAGNDNHILVTVSTNSQSPCLHVELLLVRTSLMRAFACEQFISWRCPPGYSSKENTAWSRHR